MVKANDMSELVSAIITTHNRCDLLKRAIDAALAQTYRDIEVIVVDDASTDNTADVCREYGDKITYVHISKNESRGGNYARNLGIKVSHGKYCAFCDDDDFWLPKKTEEQMCMFENSQYGLVYCGLIVDYQSDSQRLAFNRMPNQSIKGDVSKKILMSICCNTSSMIVKKDLLYEVGMFDEELKFWQEYELTIRLAQICEFTFVNKALVSYLCNENDSNRLTNKYREWKTAVSYIHKKHKNLYDNLSFKEKLAVKTMVHIDAVSRAKTSHMPWEYLKNYILSHIVTFPDRLLGLNIMPK